MHFSGLQEEARVLRENLHVHRQTVKTLAVRQQCEPPRRHAASVEFKNAVIRKGNQFLKQLSFKCLHWVIVGSVLQTTTGDLQKPLTKDTGVESLYQGSPNLFL